MNKRTVEEREKKKGNKRERREKKRNKERKERAETRKKRKKKKNPNNTNLEPPGTPNIPPKYKETATARTAKRKQEQLNTSKNRYTRGPARPTPLHHGLLTRKWVNCSVHYRQHHATGQQPMPLITKQAQDE